MNDWLARLRRLRFGNEGVRAFRAERATIREHTAFPPVDPRFEAEMRALAATAAPTLHLGHAFAAPTLPVRVPMNDLSGHGAWLIVGGSGAGKTRACLAILRAVLRHILHHPGTHGVWVQDHKSEFVALVQEVIGELVATAPAALARRLLDDLVVVNPFSTEALVPLQILRPEPGISPEEQAYEVTSVLSRIGGAELGVNQDAFAFHLILLGISLKMSCVDLLGLVDDPLKLAAAAARSPLPAVRSFFGAGTRLNAASLSGVRARLGRLLLLPSMRAMLGAADCISFPQLLNRKIVLIDTGTPPLGCEDLGRFWSNFFTLKLMRAVFSRRAAEVARPVTVFVDEWHEGLAGGSGAVEQYERALTMARSRGVTLVLITQSLANAAKISANLPRVVSTNADVQLLFRASHEDARAMAHLLPVTGRARRAPGLPWEEGRRSVFLTREEELQHRIEEVTRLPDRCFYLWNRRRSYRAELVRAVDVDLHPVAHPAAVRWRLAHGTLAVPIDELVPVEQDDGFEPVAPPAPQGRVRPPRGHR